MEQQNKFLDAIRKGLSNAELVKTREDEINKVFLDLNDELRLAFNNSISIHREKIYRKSAAASAAIALGFAVGKVIDPELLYEAIMVKSNANPSKTKIIAKWKQSGEGYPCFIENANMSYVINSQDELISAISDLLQSSEVGLIINEMLNEEKNQIDNSNEHSS